MKFINEILQEFGGLFTTRITVTYSDGTKDRLTFLKTPWGEKAHDEYAKQVTEMFSEQQRCIYERN